MQQASQELGLAARIIGLLVAIILTGIGIIFGFMQNVSVQIIILSAIATLVLFYWSWQFVLSQFIVDVSSGGPESSELRKVWSQSRMPSSA